MSSESQLRQLLFSKREKVSAEIESILVFVGLWDLAKSRDDYEPPGDSPRFISLKNKPWAIARRLPSNASLSIMTSVRFRPKAGCKPVIIQV